MKLVAVCICNCWLFQHALNSKLWLFRSAKQNYTQRTRNNRLVVSTNNVSVCQRHAHNFSFDKILKYTCKNGVAKSTDIFVTSQPNTFEMWPTIIITEILCNVSSNDKSNKSTKNQTILRAIQSFSISSTHTYEPQKFASLPFSATISLCVWKFSSTQSFAVCRVQCASNCVCVFELLSVVVIVCVQLWKWKKATGEYVMIITTGISTQSTHSLQLTSTEKKKHTTYFIPTSVQPNTQRNATLYIY